VLRGHLKRDDGAAVSLNGVEVVRDNVPAGPLGPTGLAPAFASGAQESTWYEYPVPASLLVAGTNVVAAEVHQATANNGDSTFDLQLTTHGGTETSPPASPIPTVTSSAPTAVTLGWAPSRDDTGTIGYLVRRGGATVAFTPATTFVDGRLTPGTTYAYVVLAIDGSGNASAPGAVVATTPTG
jgi:hypothetical protein